MNNLGDWVQLHWVELACLAAGWLLAVLVLSVRHNNNVRRSYALGQAHSEQQQDLAQQQHDLAMERRLRELSLLQGRHQMLEAEHEHLVDSAAHQQAQLSQAQADLAATTARLETERVGFAEKQKVFAESSATLKQEFQGLAQQVFASQGQSQDQRLSTLLQPFRDQLGDFRKRVDEVHQSETKDRASLLAQMQHLQSASESLNQEAGNLAKALKGDKKLQGNWGELVLERVLEDSGLRLNEDYLLQPARRSPAGDLKRPDAIVRLPDNKDVIVDSKVSLNAYERALLATDEEIRHAALSEHVGNLRNHVKRLAAQDYSDLSDVRSLDFVLMFVPIESAFALAMEHDPKLFTDAFTQRVVLVSPSTLMLCLRIIHNLWRFENQDRNAQEIARRAGALYDKLRGLVQDIDLLGKQLQSLHGTYDAISVKLVSGRGNLVGQAERFRELGAAVKKPIDISTLDTLAQDIDEVVLPEVKSD